MRREVKSVEEMKKELAEKREKFEKTCLALRKLRERSDEIETPDGNDDEAIYKRELTAHKERGEMIETFESEKREIEQLERRIRIAEAKRRGYEKN